MNSKKSRRVVVAMSGGVDSSVTAALLVEQGYEVIGMMMRLWSEPMADGAVCTDNKCCTPEQMADARRIADQLNIPFHVVDTQAYFRKTVVQFFIDEHENGRTPNPCIECNRKIRFEHLLNQALALGADYLATGHYARIRRTPDGYQLLQGVDAAKDQSYVLHVVGQRELAHILFPVGEYSKPQVRELARKFNLPVASKADSQDLCFVGDGDYHRFLREYAKRPFPPGPILNLDGQQIGEHTGLPFYTIGQRKGLYISAPEPLYVLKKEIAQNALIVGTRRHLERHELTAQRVNWIDGAPPSAPLPVQIKIRYKAKAVDGVVTALENGRCHVHFNQPVIGITAGQGAVFYDGDRCLGGGTIENET